MSNQLPIRCTALHCAPSTSAAAAAARLTHLNSALDLLIAIPCTPLCFVSSSPSASCLCTAMDHLADLSLINEMVAHHTAPLLLPSSDLVVAI